MTEISSSPSPSQPNRPSKEALVVTTIGDYSHMNICLLPISQAPQRDVHGSVIDYLPYMGGPVRPAELPTTLFPDEKSARKAIQYSMPAGIIEQIKLREP